MENERLGVGSVVAQRYRVDRLLGEGGMGVVYAATHLVTHKAVALKVLRGSVTADEIGKQRFLREARAACAISHPNVLPIHDILELPDGTPAMVMDLLEGESLAAKIERERVVPLAELAPLMLPVVSALGAAHELGIVHRDLKPDNIFLSKGRDGAIVVRVLDFGIAKLTSVDAASSSAAAITGSGAILGTPYYMAPEQMFAEKDVDHRADIWSIGIILYECLAGVRPTQAENVGQIFKIVMSTTIPSIDRHAPDLPQPIVALIRRMLSRERAERPADLREVASTLGKYTLARAPSFAAPAGARSDPAAKGTPRALVTTPANSSPQAFADTMEVGRKDPSASTQAPLTLSSARRATSMRGRQIALALGGLGVVALLAWRINVRSGVPGNDTARVASSASASHDTVAAVDATAPPASTSADPTPPASPPPVPSTARAATSHAVTTPSAAATPPPTPAKKKDVWNER